MAKTTISSEDALAMFENPDRGNWVEHDRSEGDAIRAAVAAREAASAAVDAAVIDARHHGLTWIAIAAALNVSPQAARQKYLARV